jgi:hypothetical protein
MYNDNETPTYEQPYQSFPTLPPSEWFTPIEQKDKAKIEAQREAVYIDKYSETTRNYITSWAGWTSAEHLVTLDLIDWSINRLKGYDNTTLTILATWWYYICFSATIEFFDNINASAPWVQVTHKDATSEAVMWTNVARYDITQKMTDIFDEIPVSCSRIFYFEQWDIIEVYIKVTTSTASSASWRAILDGSKKNNPHLTLYKLW